VRLVDRADEVVLHIAQHPEVPERNLPVVVEPPRAHFLGIAIRAEPEQEDHLDHRTTPRIGWARL
jgi:hypothetical protein